MAKGILKWLFLLGVPAAVGVAGWQGWSWWDGVTKPVADAATKPKPVLLEIKPNTAAGEIGETLEAQGLIHSAEAWKLWGRWLNRQDPSGGFKAGTYQLSPAEPMQELAAKIWAGEVVKLSYTIPEGWSIKKMADYFEKQGFFQAEEFIKAASQIPQNEFPWLPNDLPHLEGYLYPDTYKIAGDSLNPQAIINQMLRQFEQIALPVYQENKQQTKLNLKEWVTLASIVEKEAVVASERGTIAGVFTRRLEIGMTLGADPTVEYGLGVTQTPDKPLTLKQVSIPNPYNTYINAGLPPTPIASPGIESLKATLLPEKTDYLYFMARYDGTHIFSRTLAEHEAAVGKIRDERANTKSTN